MEQLVGAKAGGGLANLVDGFLERQRVGHRIGDGMLGPAIPFGPNAAIMGQTMAAEGAAQLGAFGSIVGPRLDVEDFLATSARYAQQEAAALAQMDSVMAAVQARSAAAAAMDSGPSVGDFMAFQAMQQPSAAEFAAFQAMQGPSPADFAAFQAMQGPSTEDFVALQAMCGPSMADFAAFQLAQGQSIADFAAFHALQGPSMADFAAYQEMQGLSAADFEAHAQAEVMAEFAAYQESQGPSAADFAAFQQSQTPSIADFEAFQAAQGPSAQDFQSFQQRQGPSMGDFQAFQKQVLEAEDRFASLTHVTSDQAWDMALADALSAESLGLSSSMEPLATMCAANQIPAQLILLEAKLRLTKHFESGMDAKSIDDMLQQEIDRLVLMDFHQQWPKHRQKERSCLITLLIEQQLQVKLGLETQLQYHREERGVTVTNPVNGHRISYGFYPLEGAEIDQLVCTELTLQAREAFFHPSAVLTLAGPAGTGKTETLRDICRHTIGRPVRIVQPTELNSEADLAQIFALMDAGIFVVLDVVEKSPVVEELLPMLIARAQTVYASSSGSSTAGPVLGITYHSRPETMHIDSMTTSDPTFGRVEMSRPPLDNILRTMFALESFTRYDAVSAIVLALNCCCSVVGDNHTRLTVADEVDTSPSATIAGNHIGLRHLQQAVRGAGERLRETSGAGDAAAELEALWCGLGASGIMTMMKEHEATKALALAIDFVQGDSNAASLLITMGRPDPLQLSHMEALFQCKRHGVMITQVPAPEAELIVEQLAMARGAITNRIELSSGSLEEVTTALAAAFNTTPEGMPQLISVGGVALQAQAWDALNTLLDDNKKLTLPSGELVALPDGTQILFLAETRLHEPPTAAGGSRLAVFQMQEPMTLVETQLDFTAAVDVALGLPDAVASLEQIRENTQQRTRRLIARLRGGLTKSERNAVENHLIALNEHMRLLAEMQAAGPDASTIWQGTVKYYNLLPAGSQQGANMPVALSVAEEALQQVMHVVRPKHRALAQARTIGDSALVAACEADLFDALPWVHQARNGVAAARAASMQVVAECNGVILPVEVASAAVIGSTISSDFTSLVKTKITHEQKRTYFSARAEGKVLVLRGPAGSGKTGMMKDLERELGVDPVVISCTDLTDDLLLTEQRLVEAIGSLSAGSVVILDEFNRLPAKEMLVAFRLAKELELRMSISMNPGYGGHYNIPAEIAAQCLFLDVYPSMADPQTRFELHRGLLGKSGFVHSDELAAKWGTLMDAIATQCRKPHYDFGIRFQVALIQQAGRLLSLDPTLDETELLGLSILKPLWAAMDDADRGVVLTLMAEIFEVVPTVPGLWAIPGPVGKAAMMGSVLEQRHGGMMLLNPLSSTEMLLALHSEARARQAELVVIDYAHGEAWEAQFVRALQHAAASGHVVWLATDMTQSSLEGANLAAWFGPINTLLDDRKCFCTSAGDVVELAPNMRTLFVAPPSAIATMSPATIARLGMVDATGL